MYVHVLVFVVVPFKSFSHGLFSLSWMANRWQRQRRLSCCRKNKKEYCSLFFSNMFDTWSVSFYVMCVMTISIYCISQTGVLLLLLFLFLFFSFDLLLVCAFCTLSLIIITYGFCLSETEKKLLLLREKWRTHAAAPVNNAGKWTWVCFSMTILYILWIDVFKIWNIMSVVLTRSHHIDSIGILFHHRSHRHQANPINYA